MHTEEQAKELWCPESRQMVYGLNDRDMPEVREWPFPSINRHLKKDSTIAIPSGCLGIASACMAWRWLPERWVERDTGAEWTYEQPSRDDGAVIKIIEGYCGKYGRPT